MLSLFKRFPEVMLVDATHKLNDQNMPLYGLLVVDGHGESHLVACFLVVKEDEATLRKMVMTFQEHNPNWTKVQTVVTDKDFVERTVFKSLMPNVRLEMCLFHTFRSFSREITIERMGITSSQRTEILKSLTKVTYSQTEQLYQDNYEKLCEVMTAKVKDYFDANWHNIRSEWVHGLKGFNLSNNTTNRIESFFSHVKSVICRRAPLKDMIQNFLQILQTLRTERYYRMVKKYNKRNINS